MLITLILLLVSVRGGISRELLESFTMPRYGFQNPNPLQFHFNMNVGQNGFMQNIPRPVNFMPQTPQIPQQNIIQIKLRPNIAVGQWNVPPVNNLFNFNQYGYVRQPQHTQLNINFHVNTQKPDLNKGGIRNPINKEVNQIHKRPDKRPQKNVQGDANDQENSTSTGPLVVNPVHVDVTTHAVVVTRTSKTTTSKPQQNSTNSDADYGDFEIDVRSGDD
jgi:hypothetical protein